MSLPPPKPGLVIRLSYLWAKEHAIGREEGQKDRPAAIVMALVIEGGAIETYALPITHSKPKGDTVGIEIPSAIAAGIGLDVGRHWIVISEFNVFRWPGFDLRPIPGKSPKGFAYGFLPPGFFAIVRDAWLALDRKLKSTEVPRDG